MTEIDLRERFPNFEPDISPPTLFRVNGIGLAVYGARDHDIETGTYIKTYCLSFLFIPILAIRAYRVAKADCGWYFLGREPLSVFAKGWNFTVIGTLLSFVAFVVWDLHASSPAYQAQRQLAQARRLADTGHLAEAARIYRNSIVEGSAGLAEAEAALHELLDGPVRQASCTEAAGVFEVVRDLHRWSSGPYVVPDLLERGIAKADQCADADPRGALAVLDAVAPRAEVPEVLVARRQPLLEQAIAVEPDDVELLSKLALVYESQSEFEKCESLLAPHEKRLGASEAARILGQICARQGHVEESFSLLFPYTEQHLGALHAAEQAYDNTVNHIGNEAVERLRQGKGPDWFYDRYERASEEKQQAMVDDYVTTAIRQSDEVQAAQEALLRSASIVPVALDLGIVRLRRAQAMADAEARSHELEAAEKTFLAIRGLAGESDEYRLSLGQVNYWLGKHEEGRELFDDLLASKNRSFEMLLAVSAVLRDVGADSEARALAEEAYYGETDPAKRYLAAQQRALILTDLDDQIEWLSRADPENDHVQAGLNAARGDKAIQEGDNIAAGRYLRDAIAGYERQVPSVGSLNNAALACSSLFQATGDREAYVKGVELLDKAVALEPGDSIVLFNAATATLQGALADIIGDAIDLQTLHLRADLTLLPYLYKDAAGREVWRQRVQSHPGVAKALGYFDKVLVLAPKNADAYEIAASIHVRTRNAEALRDLVGRVQQGEVSDTDEHQQALDFYAGKMDTTHRADFEASIARFEKLVDLTRDRARDTTFAVAACHLIDDRLRASLLGVPSDADAMVALAEEAHGAAPSATTRTTLINSLLFRASQDIARHNAAYAAMVSKASRALSPGHLIAAAMVEAGEQGDAAMNNADVQRAIELIIEDAQVFPDTRTAWEWAMLRVARPDEAEKAARAIQQDEIGRLDTDINERLHPTNATAAMRSYWLAIIDGNEATGVEILKRCAARGVPMPFDLE